LAAHGLLILFFATTGFFSLFRDLKSLAPKQVNPVALRAVPESAWSRNRQVRPGSNQVLPPPALRAEERALEEKAKEREPVPKGSVVDVAPGNGQKPDEDAKFLAETNNRVEKETRSRHSTLDYRNAAPKPSASVKQSESKSGQDQAKKEVIAGNGGKGSEEDAPREGQKRFIFEVPSLEKKDRLALKLDGLGPLSNREESDALSGNSNRLRIQAGGDRGEDSKASAGRPGSQELQTLTPSASVFDRIAGAPASDVTKLDDVEEGEGTYLNTREWKYSSFFNRIKQTVGMHWDPNAAMRQRDPTGEIFLYKDRITVVTVTLDQQGLLKDVEVEKPSGVDFLDREAVAAFQRSQPFPNPPPALRNAHGEIRFNFGFYLEVNRSSMRWFSPLN
jgi:TonB family protein